MRVQGSGMPVMGATQPWNRVVFPSAGAASAWQPMTPELAKSLPGIARGMQLICGMGMQMPMDDYRGIDPLPRPRLLEQPDPDQSRAWFVGLSWEDYLLNGNAVQFVTSRNSEGLPATTAWLPASWVWVGPDPDDNRQPSYWVSGVQLPREQVIHVKRGSDRTNPFRGVGVVEQHLEALGTVRDQMAYEREVLQGAAVPSVAIITPNPELSTDEADEAKTMWLEKYAGPVRKPAVLPAGTSVVPLAWSPADSELIEARKLSLIDQANILNLDGYWLGAESGSHTYKSPGPMYLNLLRQTVGPIAEVFEDVWSAAWLPRGRRVRFDRKPVLADDLETTVRTMVMAIRGNPPLLSVEEARTFMGLTPQFPTSSSSTSITSPVATVEAPPAEPVDPGEGDTRSITINVTGGMDPQAVAKELQRVLADHNRRNR